MKKFRQVLQVEWIENWLVVKVGAFLGYTAYSLNCVDVHWFTLSEEQVKTFWQVKRVWQECGAAPVQLY